jgi:hypothetical protein
MLRTELSIVGAVCAVTALAGPWLALGPASATPNGVESGVLDNLMLPPGSKLVDRLTPTLELWEVPSSVDDTVAFVGRQLPVNRDLAGAPWCDQIVDTTYDVVSWTWAGNGLLIVVGVMPGLVFPGGSSVNISADADNEGCTES